MSRKTGNYLRMIFIKKQLIELGRHGAILNRYVLHELGSADSVLFINLQELVRDWYMYEFTIKPPR